MERVTKQTWENVNCAAEYRIHDVTILVTWMYVLEGLGVAFVSKNWKIAVAPVALMLVLFIFVPALNSGTVGIMVPVSVLFTIAVARILYKRGVL